jgi:hypothetical protein
MATWATSRRAFKRLPREEQAARIAFIRARRLMTALNQYDEHEDIRRKSKR